MASLNITSTTQTSISVQIVDLAFADSLYDFQFAIDGSGYFSSGSSSYSFGGLSCGTSHSFMARARYPKTTGTWYEFSTSGSTSACPPSPPNPPSGSASAGNGSATVTAYFDSTASYVEAYIVPNTRTISSSGGSTTFTGLNNGQTYTPFIRTYRTSTGLYSDWVQLNSITPSVPANPSPPSISYSATNTTVTTNVTFGANTHHVNVYIAGASIPTLVLYANGSVTHTGLTSGTTYTVYYQAWDSTETYGSGPANYTIKTTGGTRPTNFSGWGVTVATGQPFIITATKWLAFQTKINEFRIYKGLQSYGFTTGSYVVTDQPFYYWLANQARTAISDMSPPTSVPSAVVSGGDCTASWFNGIVNSLNSVV